MLDRSELLSRGGGGGAIKGGGVTRETPRGAGLGYHQAEEGRGSEKEAGRSRHEWTLEHG